MATIIFDFDDTLFDTNRFKKDIFQILEKTGLKKDLLQKTYLEVIEKDNYTFKKHLKEIRRSVSKLNTKEVSKSLHNLLENKYLFESVEINLKKLKERHKIILLTKGDVEFQNIKIKESGISKIFNKKDIYIVAKDKLSIIKKINLEEEVYFINDKKTENDLIKKEFPKFKYFLVSNKNSVTEIIRQI